MPVDATFAAPGRFWKGNLHTHSTRPDAARDAEVVCALYRDAGYDFLALTDHFLPAFGFPIVDTRGFRTNRFTTILGQRYTRRRPRLASSGTCWPWAYRSTSPRRRRRSARQSLLPAALRRARTSPLRIRPGTR